MTLRPHIDWTVYLQLLWLCSCEIVLFLLEILMLLQSLSIHEGVLIMSLNMPVGLIACCYCSASSQTAIHTFSHLGTA